MANSIDIVFAILIHRICGVHNNYLGNSLLLIDPEKLDETNLNRYVGTRPTDVGRPKVEIWAQNILEIDSDVKVRTIYGTFVRNDAFDWIKTSDYVFGCLDKEGARLILNELCLAYERPLFDLASDIIPGSLPVYGGRVCFINGSAGCLYCLNELDISEASLELQGSSRKNDLDAIYGVASELLGEAGPSVISLNGVVASLAITEFMVEVTGLRRAHKLIKYYGEKGIVSKNIDSGKPDCYYCGIIKGKGKAAEVEQYIERGVDVLM